MKLRLALFALTLCAAGPVGAQSLDQNDVGNVIGRVVTEAAARNAPATIAVVDRVGAVLAVYAMAGAPSGVPVINNPRGANAPPLVEGLNGQTVPATAAAIAKAVTAAYLSSNQNAFSSRTASQIVQDHFNPGIRGTSSGPLYGVQFSQLPCSDLAVRLDAADSSTLARGPHRSPLGLAADPGGLPLYKNGVLVGGVGVKTQSPYGYDPGVSLQDQSTDEILALAGTSGLQAPAAIRADQISAGGLFLRFSDAQDTALAVNPATAPPLSALPSSTGGLVDVAGYFSAAGGVLAGTMFGTPASGVTPDVTGLFGTGPAPLVLVDGSGNPRYPARAGDGPSALTRAEALAILSNAYKIANQTRAQIRIPQSSVAQVTISLVDAYGQILGVISSRDMTVFGVDVSLQKARSAAFLSSSAARQGLASAGLGRFNAAFDAFFGGGQSAPIAWSARSIGNVSRDSYPDGIDGTPNGPWGLPQQETTPFSDGLQLDLVLGNLAAHLGAIGSGGKSADTPAYCTAIPAPAGSPSGLPVLANGLQIFPGGFPIYRGNTLIGAIGISGDGVDQDDMIGFLAVYGAAQLGSGLGHAPTASRSSALSHVGVHPKYVGCPFAPFLNGVSQNPCAGK